MDRNDPLISPYICYYAIIVNKEELLSGATAKNQKLYPLFISLELNDKSTKSTTLGLT